jgi:hypothetical protein
LEPFCERQSRGAAQACNTPVFFVQRLIRLCFAGCMPDSLARFRSRYKEAAQLSRPVTDLGELMTTESRRAAVRPLLLTAAWFAFLAATAFAWAAIENQQSPAPNPPIFVHR